MHTPQFSRALARRLLGLCVAVSGLAGALPAVAQTCVTGVRASNPSSVYLIDTSVQTVVDTRTGLMWDRCAWGQSGLACATDTGAAGLTWLAALDVPITANGANYKGHNDWRLPNVKELRSLVEECRISPSINEWAFPNTPPGYHWTNSPSARLDTAAWDVSFSNGLSSIEFRTVSYRVRLVRAGQ
jgi:Protein of unknown function (DUF1566)